MPSVPLHPPVPSSPLTATPPNPLPPLLHTPTGLALVEIQGTIHFPPPSSLATSTAVGKLVFPLYNPLLHGEEDTKWMKRVYLYVGENQRMVGECKKLGRPFAIVRKRGGGGGEGDAEGEEGAMEGVQRRGAGEGDGEELEIVEVVKYKVVFSGRPEPVGGGTVER